MISQQVPLIIGQPVFISIGNQQRGFNEDSPIPGMGGYAEMIESVGRHPREAALNAMEYLQTGALRSSAEVIEAFRAYIGPYPRHGWFEFNR